MIKTLSKRTKKDVKRRYAFERIAYQLYLLKSILKNIKFSTTIRHYARYKLSKLYKKKSFSKMNRYCVYSSNYKSVYKKYKLSRHFLKDFFRSGKIVGISKK